jgi:F0F1-type ATP synthase delta subunit
MNDAKTIAYAVLHLEQDGYTPKKIIDGVYEWLKVSRKLKMIPAIIHEIERISKVIEKYETITIESPFNLDHKIIEDIRAKITEDNDAPIDFQINRDLLGGFLVKYKGVKTDATLKRQLQEVSNTLKN